MCSYSFRELHGSPVFEDACPDKAILSIETVLPLLSGWESEFGNSNEGEGAIAMREKGLESERICLRFVNTR